MVWVCHSPKEEDARIAATFDVIAVIVVASLAWWSIPPAKIHRSTRDAATATPLAPAPKSVTIVDGAPRASRCDDQTWPYIARHCLNYGPADEGHSPPEAAVVSSAGDNAGLRATDGRAGDDSPAPVAAKAAGTGVDPAREAADEIVGTEPQEAPQKLQPRRARHHRHPSFPLFRF